MNRMIKEQQEWLKRENECLVKEQQKQQEIAAMEQTLEHLLAKQHALKESIQSMELDVNLCSPSPPQCS